MIAKAQTEQDASTSDSSDRRSGRETYRPKSYSELIDDAVGAVKVALEDGLTRLEVEFPAVSNVDGKLPPYFEVFVVNFSDLHA